VDDSLEDKVDWLNPPAAEAKALVPVDPMAERDAKLVTVFAALSPKQQTVLQTLQLNYFNLSKTLRILKASGDAVDPATYYRWGRQDPDFKFALQTMKAQARDDIDPERVLLRVQEIAEDALRPKEVYFKGAPTGEKRKDYAASLKASELQMKQKKLLGEEKDSVFGGRTINFNVQIVQSDGTLKAAERRTGLVIDMPVVELPDES